MPTSKYGSVINPSNSLPVVFLDRPDTASLRGREWIAKFNFFQCIKLNLRQFQRVSPQFSQSSAISSTRLLYLHIKGFKPTSTSSRTLTSSCSKLDVCHMLSDPMYRLSMIGWFLGIINKMKTTEFRTTPIVFVLKPSGQVRICGDLKVSVNQYLDLTQYFLPHIEEVFKGLYGGQVFSKLDLPDAYLHVELDDEPKRHVVITTHRGLYRSNRLFF